MSGKFFEFFNYGSIVLVLILLVLMLTDMVDKDWYLPLLIFGLILLVLRLVLRIYFSVKRNKTKE